MHTLHRPWSLKVWRTARHFPSLKKWKPKLTLEQYRSPPKVSLVDQLEKVYEHIWTGFCVPNPCTISASPNIGFACTKCVAASKITSFRYSTTDQTNVSAIQSYHLSSHGHNREIISKGPFDTCWSVFIVMAMMAMMAMRLMMLMRLMRLMRLMVSRRQYVQKFQNNLAKIHRKSQEYILWYVYIYISCAQT